ncbi:MAG: AmmeMemoRadiSam system protein B [Bacteroidota bacterium]
MNSNGKQLFDSLTQPVPPLRRDVQMVPVSHKGQRFVVAHDSMGYVPHGFALPAEAVQLLHVFDGRTTLQQLMNQIEQQAQDEQVGEEQLRTFVRQLDEYRLLYSDHFKHYAEKMERAFEEADVRKPTSAGISYPDEKSDLIAQLDDAFAQWAALEKHAEEATPKALYAPHIDPRVGMESYVKAFKSIRNLQPKRVVIIATSHYSGTYPEVYQDTPFIASRKTFELPHGSIAADQQALDQLEQKAERLGVSFQDRAHRTEHSIELHLLFLRYIWSHDFEIVPLLVGDFQDLFYMRDGHTGDKLDQMAQWLRNQYADDPDTFFLISGDLAHIGPKFGDQQSAREMLEPVKSFDEQFLELAQRNDSQGLIEHMKAEFDPYRICGFPPLLTFLETLPEVRGKQLSYQVWDESERDSAVTFGSLLFR